MSRRRFDGWTPESTTTFEYDDAGRLVRSVTVVESEWDDRSQAEVLALARFDEFTCSGCGGWLPETTCTDASDWRVDLPHRCGKCTALQVAQSEYGKSQKHVEATRWSATRR